MLFTACREEDEKWNVQSIHEERYWKCKCKFLHWTRQLAWNKKEGSRYSDFCSSPGHSSVPVLICSTPKGFIKKKIRTVQEDVSFVPWGCFIHHVLRVLHSSIYFSNITISGWTCSCGEIWCWWVMAKTSTPWYWSALNPLSYHYLHFHSQCKLQWRRKKSGLLILTLDTMYAKTPSSCWMARWGVWTKMFGKWIQAWKGLDRTRARFSVRCQEKIFLFFPLPLFFIFA